MKRVVTVVAGAAYEAMHSLTKPLFEARWGVQVEPFYLDEPKHWPNAKVLLLMQGPLLLIDCDVFPLSKPDWDQLNPDSDCLEGVYDGGQYNTGCVWAPRGLSQESIDKLERIAMREFIAPMYEQDRLQRLPWKKLDPRWANIVGRTDGWGVHFAGGTVESKLERMQALCP